MSKDSTIWVWIPTLNLKTLDLNRFEIISDANIIGDFIWEEVNSWRNFERDTLGKQIVRAADSISANLSEGYGRYSIPDRKRFAIYARGSMCETQNWVSKLIDRQLIDSNKGETLMSMIKQFSMRLNAYIKSLDDHPGSAR